jgi:hypothetical protein
VALHPFVAPQIVALHLSVALQLVAQISYFKAHSAYIALFQQGAACPWLREAATGCKQIILFQQVIFRV